MMFRRLCSYSRLKGDEVLLVFIIHFASDYIGYIHHCGIRRKKKGKVRFLLQDGMYWVCDCLQHQSNGLFL